jgi:O-antigen ligase
MAFSFAALRDWGGEARLPFRLQAVLIGLICFAAGGVPRLLPALLGLLALVAAFHVFTTEPRLPLKLAKTAFGVALAISIAYLFVNALWAPHRLASFAKAATVLGLSASAFLVTASYSLRTGAEARVLAKSALAGLILGAAFLLFEIVFHESVMLYINNHLVQVFEITPKKMKIEQGRVTEISTFVLNRNVTSIVLLLIPSLLLTVALPTKTARRVAIAALVVVTAVSTLLSESGTSVMAFFVGALVLALAALSLKAARLLIVGAWIVAVLLAVPLGALPYKLGWENWTWLPPESVGARFYIWKYVADEVYQRPLAGIGIRGSRDLHLRIPTDAGDPSHAAYALQGRQARHPHNIYLQTWLELGAIGAVLLLCLGLAALWTIGTWPPLLQGAGYSLFAVGSAVGVSGFDFWQTWMLAAVTFGWTAIMLAFRLPELTSFLADRTSSTASAEGKAALRAPIG